MNFFLFFVACISILQPTLSTPMRDAPSGMRCEKGQVYVAYGDRFKPNYALDDTRFCCPISETEFQFSEPTENTLHLECCAGATNPIYDQRNHSCVKAKVVPKIEPSLRCIQGQVYASYGDPQDTSSYEIDLTRFCCPVNHRNQVEYSEPTADVAYLECCTGAAKPIYDRRNQTCEEATVVTKTDNQGVTLPEPFQFLYYIRIESCAKMDRATKTNNAAGTLLLQTTSKMLHGSQSIVPNFSLVGHIKCSRRINKWYLLPSSRYLSAEADSLTIHINDKLLPVPREINNFLNSYLASLQEAS